VDGRNGMFHIQKLYIWESVDHEHVYLEGIGKRGVSIRGGFLVTKDCFTDVCREFLGARARHAGVGKDHETFSPADDCQINEEGFCKTHQKVHLREQAADMEIPAGNSVTKEWNMRCPQCCSDEGIEICCNIWARLHTDGTTTDDTQDGSHEWNAESPARCRRCDFSGTVLDFETVVDDEERSNGPKKA
jgi:hypothetical protein